MSYCPECEAVVDLDTDELEEGEIVACPECGTDLEVVSTNPLELRPAEDEDEEEDEEEDEDDEDQAYEEDEDEDEDYDE